jgi:hypothetical protein
MNRVCFEANALYTYIFILLVIIILFIYVYTHKEHSNLYLYQQKILNLQQELSDIKIAEKDTTGNSNVTLSSTQDKFLNKIYNPLAPPENIYFGGSLSNPPYDAYQNYQQLGFISNETGQFPVFGRFKYPNKSDRLEYYTINEGRNRIKIPLKTKNFEELYDGDQVTVLELSNKQFQFNKYENENVRYNPYELL